MQDFEQTTIQKPDRKLDSKQTYKTVNLHTRQTTLTVSERTSDIHIYIYIPSYSPYIFLRHFLYIPYISSYIPYIFPIYPLLP